MRIFLVLITTIAAIVLAPGSLHAQDVTITIKNHRFTPAEVKVPANKRIQITVVNDDPTPEEFESQGRESNTWQVEGRGAHRSACARPLPFLR